MPYEGDAPIYAEILGYGTTNDAYHMVQPSPTGEQAKRAIQLALAECEYRSYRNRLY